jgi:PKD repeat protein
MKRRTLFSVIAAVVLNCLATSALAQGISNPDQELAAAVPDALHKPAPRRQKVRIHDPELAQQLSQQGGELIADYGSFQLFRLDDTLARTAFSLPGAEKADHQNIITLNARHLDTTTPEVKALRESVLPSSGKRLHLVQFAGPIKPEWRDALEGTGVRVITYIPHNAYLVYGQSTALGQMQAWAATADYVQWEGAYRDDYKIHPQALMLDEKGNPQKPATDLFAIQLVADEPANASTLQLVDVLKSEPIKRQFAFLDYLNLVVRIPPERLPQLAAQPEVISIQPYLEPHKMDERQDIIMVGNLIGNGPTAPGYLAFLANAGFAQSQFAASGFAVDITDSGLDNGTTSPGHFGLYTLGDSSQPSRVIYNRLLGTPHPGSTLQGCDGHGTLNTHIIGGYNDRPVGFPHTDSAGYHYGLGVCPFVKFGSSVIFDPDTFTFPNFTTLQSQAYRDGARVSGNSWGADTAGAYTADSQTYDALVRDAQPSGSTVPVTGNQEMVIVFAAGNAGAGVQTVGAPGTAKNVITVGASENVRSMSTANGGNDPSGNTSCGIDDSGADNANDIAFFSSRGPCADGRRKPELVAPGTHITGGVAQNSPPPSPSGTGSAIACFKGTGVCALAGGGTVNNPDNFFPLNQQFYTTSSGTSHSTPAVAGSCALLRQFFINSGLNAPSPAMTKAFLMNSTRYLNGSGANDTLWSNNQGMGEVNLGMAFDGTARIVRDELAADKFTGTGQSRTFSGTVADPSKPFRVTLAWTDAPGNTTGNAFNNDLDLTVTVGGNTFKGNVFSGANSVTGGSADNKNNAESVFLPAGVSGGFSVTVTAANINSDGVPNQAPSLDQDFALVVYNGTQVVAPVITADDAAIVDESCSPANGAPDPGETITVNFGLRNVGVANSTNLVATLLATNGVSSPSAPRIYGPLVAGGATVSKPFTFTATAVCGANIFPTFQLQDGSQSLGTVSFSLVMGQLVSLFSENFDGVLSPSLPVGWTTTTTGDQSAWVSSAASSDTSPNAAFSPDPGLVGLNELDSPVINLPTTTAQLTFRHNYNLESASSTVGFDGGVLEIKIGSGAFTDILAAGGSFVSGGYDHTLSTDFQNPLPGRQAWSGNSGGFITTIVNLPASAQGQAIQLRWRCGTDLGGNSIGWFVDTVSIQVRACCSQLSAPPSASFIASPTNGQAPLTVTFTDTSTGTITNRFWNFGNGVTTNTSATRFSIVYPAAGTDTVSLTVSGPSGTDTLTRSGSILIFTNSPPTVAITSPANGASFIAPATFTIQATASDSDGSVTNVQFFDGNTSLGNRSSSPFNLSVSLGVGQHALTAVASDNLGATKATPLPVTVDVASNAPPTVAIINPTNGATFIAPATITIQATASDGDGSVTNVQFFDGNTSLGNRSSSPFNLSVSLGVGQHALTAVASDNLGATKATPLPVTVNVASNSPPTVAITSPTNGTSFIAPATITIQATASDIDGSVTNVQFFDGNTSLGNRASSPFNLSVTLGVGSHALTAVASDNLGATKATPLPVTVNVFSNSPPTAAITSPTNGATFIAPATITIQATASDTDGIVTNVQFFDGTTSLGNVSSSPFNLSVSLGVGPHALTAVASDNLGATKATPLPITVNVASNSPPTVAITNPTNGASFIAPATITIQATASDSDGSVTNVQFFDGNTSLGNRSFSPFNLSVTLEVGPHALTAVASDNLGATKRTMPVTVNVVSNSPPTVAITSPTNGTSFIAPATITIQATASDSDGSVTNVQFFDGTTSLGNASSSPFNLSVSLGVGSHALTAVASDNLGATKGTPPVTVNVVSNSPPTVAIINPTNGATFIAPATITIQATASDSDGSITNVQFFDGNTSLGNVSSSPFNLSVSLGVGPHALTAVASDNLGATKATPLPVTVNVASNAPPTVAITSPTNGATFIAPATITIQATASDSDGSVTNVQFFDGNTSLGNVSSGPFNLSVSLGVGPHALTAVASDNLGATKATPLPVTVNVASNAPPTVAITSPTNGATFIAPATITIQATASDSDGSITNVQFFDGNTSLGSVSSSPFNLSVSLGVGAHALTAVASDNFGATEATPLPVAVTVTTNTPPTEVSIPDPGLNAAIRQALQKLAGTLTTQDLLSLTNLDASGRNIRSLEGLEAASNLISLNLQSNQLSNFSLPNEFTNLKFLDLSLNSLTNCSFPGGLMKLATLNLEGNLLTSLTLPAGLNDLNSLELSENRFTSFNLPSNLTSLTFFDLSFNPLTNVELPSGLTNLTMLVIHGNNVLTNLDLPQGLTALETLDIDHNLLLSVGLPADLKSLTRLDLEDNQLSSLTLPAGMTNLEVLSLELNHLDSLALPADLTQLAFFDLTGNLCSNLTLPGSLTALTNLDLAINLLSSFTLPGSLTNLTSLDLFENALTNFTLPDGLTALTNLNLAVNQLSGFTVPPDATNLSTLFLFFNQSLTNLTLVPGMNNLMEVRLSGDRLANLALPPGLTNLSLLDLTGNQLTDLTLPLDMTNLATLVLDGNPLTTLTLSQQLATTNLATLVASLRNQGVTVIILSTTPNNPPVLAAIPDQTVAVGTSLVITNLANDPDSPPQVLTFSLGNSAAPNASIDAASGVFSWTPTLDQVGTNIFTVEVIDDGQPPLSAFQTFLVVVLPPNAPPTVAITSPTNGASFTAPATITIQAAASDSDGSITNVQFFDGDTFLGSVSSSPYNLSVSLAVGSHALIAVASDNLGATAPSLPATVTGLTPIVISGASNLPDGTFQFAFTNTPGASFSVLTSTNLALPVEEWTSAGAALETAPGSYQFTDETPGVPQRYYRVRSP